MMFARAGIACAAITSSIKSAASQGIAAFFATGDSGVHNSDKPGANYPFPTVTFPGSSVGSLVTRPDPVGMPPPVSVRRTWTSR
jgi:hypothetical protein